MVHWKRGLIKETSRIHDKKISFVRGAPPDQIRSFFEHLLKGGGRGQTHVQKICCKFCIIIKAYWQHKMDTKRLFKGKNVSN